MNTIHGEISTIIPRRTHHYAIGMLQRFSCKARDAGLILLSLLYLTFSGWMIADLVAVPCVGTGDLNFDVSTADDGEEPPVTRRTRRHIHSLRYAIPAAQIKNIIPQQHEHPERPCPVAHILFSNAFYYSSISDKAPPPSNPTQVSA